MKEAASSTWSFQMIILFILIFAGFLSLVLVYSKVYTIKNRMLTIIEKYEGITDESANIINNFASKQSYRAKSSCPTEEGWIGAVNLNTDVDMSNDYQPAETGGRYYYCFRERTAANDQAYYEVLLFYKFNLPFLGDLITFRIKGETKTFIGNDDRITKGE